MEGNREDGRVRSTGNDDTLWVKDFLLDSLVTCSHRTDIRADDGVLVEDRWDGRAGRQSAQV